MCATTRLICPTWKGAGIPECVGVKLKAYGRSGGWMGCNGTPKGHATQDDGRSFVGEKIG